MAFFDTLWLALAGALVDGLSAPVDAVCGCGWLPAPAWPELCMSLRCGQRGQEHDGKDFAPHSCLQVSRTGFADLARLRKCTTDDGHELTV